MRIGGNTGTWNRRISLQSRGASLRRYKIVTHVGRTADTVGSMLGNFLSRVEYLIRSVLSARRILASQWAIRAMGYVMVAARVC